MEVKERANCQFRTTHVGGQREFARGDQCRSTGEKNQLWDFVRRLTAAQAVPRPAVSAMQVPTTAVYPAYGSEAGSNKPTAMPVPVAKILRGQSGALRSLSIVQQSAADPTTIDP